MPRSSQFPKASDRFNQKPQNSSQMVAPTNMPSSTAQINPEHMSLDAHKHIQKYLTTARKSKLDQNDLNAVLRLSQHLRTFGLLSAVGYINQGNSQEDNETRKRTVPVWLCLLGQMLAADTNKKELMEKVVKMANDKPSEYMANWQKSLTLANHWNFWARAYLED